MQKPTWNILLFLFLKLYFRIYYVKKKKLLIQFLEVHEIEIRLLQFTAFLWLILHAAIQNIYLCVMCVFYAYNTYMHIIVLDVLHKRKNLENWLRSLEKSLKNLCVVNIKHNVKEPNIWRY